jgi:hypothetical protein
MCLASGTSGMARPVGFLVDINAVGLQPNVRTTHNVHLDAIEGDVAPAVHLVLADGLAAVNVFDTIN